MSGSCHNGGVHAEALALLVRHGKHPSLDVLPTSPCSSLVFTLSRLRYQISSFSFPYFVAVREVLGRFTGKFLPLIVLTVRGL